jgi:hypothetical protein
MLNKSPILTDNCVKPLVYTSAARIAFQAILERLELTAKKKMLLPAYVGIIEMERSDQADLVVVLVWSFLPPRSIAKLNPRVRPFTQIILHPPENASGEEPN